MWCLVPPTESALTPPRFFRLWRRTKQLLRHQWRRAFGQQAATDWSYRWRSRVPISNGWWAVRCERQPCRGSRFELFDLCLRNRSIIEVVLLKVVFVCSTELRPGLGPGAVINCECIEHFLSRCQLRSYDLHLQAISKTRRLLNTRLPAHAWYA